MVGGTEQISQRGIQRDKKKKAFFEEGWGGWMAVPQKGEGWGLVGCSKGRVGLLGSSTGGGTGSGGNPRASVPEGQVCYFSKVGGLTSCLVLFGVREGLAWRGKGLGGARARGGPRASFPDGEGGGGTNPVFCRFWGKNGVFWDALWGGGVPTGAGLLDGEGPWLQERVGGGVGAGWLGLGWLLQRGASSGKGWLAWQFHKGQWLGWRLAAAAARSEGHLCGLRKGRCVVREALAWRGKGSGGVQRLRFRGG